MNGWWIAAIFAGGMFTGCVLMACSYMLGRIRG